MIQQHAGAVQAAEHFRAPATPPEPLTWALITEAEPRLASLVERARSRKPRRRELWIAYEACKSELKSLVGWFARRPELRNSDAYDLAHGRLLSALEGRR